MAKTICWFQYTKRNRSWDGDKDGKALMNNGKLKKQNRCKTCEQQKRLYKWTSKPSYMSRKTFDNDLVAIYKNKVTLMLNNPAYTEMFTLELSKVLMYEFFYDYIKNKYMVITQNSYSQALIV